MKFKTATTAILKLSFLSILVKFPAEAVYPTGKFHLSTSIGGWVIAVCAKIQDGSRRHLEL